MDHSGQKGSGAGMPVNHRIAKLDAAQIAKRLRIVRQALGVTSGDFARSIGVDPSSYSKIEAGAKPLKMEMGFAVAETYGVTMDYLYRGLESDLPAKIAAHLRQTRKGQ